MTIEAVIFDFGGVILDLDFPATDRALRALLGDSAEVRYTKSYQSKIFDAFEIGAIEPEAFYQSIREEAGAEICASVIDKAWNAMLGDVPKERFQFLKDVAQHHRIFLFSNTNAIHKIAFDTTLERHLGVGGFDRLFERAYYSHLFGKRKPHPETYTAVLAEQGLNPASTLFIDDNLENIRGAEAAGLQVVHLTGDLLQDPRLAELIR